jgi:biotin carboxyl carrier protein
LQGNAELGIRKIDPQAASQPVAAAGQGGKAAEYSLTVDGKEYFLAFEGNNVTVDGNVFQVEISNRTSGDSPAGSASSGGAATDVSAQMPGVVLRVVAQKGDKVQAGDTLLVLEAMKMEVAVATPCNGTVQGILVSEGQQVANGEKLATIG